LIRKKSFALVGTGQKSLTFLWIHRQIIMWAVNHTNLSIISSIEEGYTAFFVRDGKRI
jgi:hypothetical protein